MAPIRRTRGNPNKNPNPKKSKMLLKNFEVLSREEKNSLMTSIEPLNIRCAKRDHAVGYLHLLEKKIHAIRQCTRLGKDFDNLKLNFNTEFVYKVLIDMFVLMDDYLKLKDTFLYKKYAEDSDKSDCMFACNNCEIEHLFWKEREYLAEDDENTP